MHLSVLGDSVSPEIHYGGADELMLIFLKVIGVVCFFRAALLSFS